jgi:NMD protein affecting ribosome stability and mRNA decay
MARKKYNTLYKKKLDVHRDSFLPRRAPKETLRCSGCAAFYYRRRWSLSAPANFVSPASSRPVFCPACQKIKQRSASGELYLRAIKDSDRRDILRLLRNEESKAREKNPLERIIRIEAIDSGWKIATTTEKLAQRLGRSISKARGGPVAFKWSHNNKFVRVLWAQQGTAASL